MDDKAEVQVLRALDADEMLSVKVVQARIGRRASSIRAALTTLLERRLVERSFRTSSNGRVQELWRRTQRGTQRLQNVPQRRRCPTCKHIL